VKYDILVADMKTGTEKTEERKGLQGPMQTWMKRHKVANYHAAFGLLSTKGLACSFQAFMNWIDGRHPPTGKHAAVLVREGVVTWKWLEQLWK